jgi:hypothetical protein
VDATEKFFVLCVKKGIVGETVTETPKDVDYQKLYKLCHEHVMSVAVFLALKEVFGALPVDFYQKLKKSASYLIMHDERIRHDTEKVIDVLEKSGVKYMPLKGYYLKPLYFESAMRYASDCDILIDVKELGKVREVLINLGLKIKKQDEHHDVFYFPESSSAFEIHKLLFVGGFEKYFGEGFYRAEPSEIKGGLYKLSDEDFYMTLIAHTAYHFLHSAGFGLRHLTDLYLFRNSKSLNYEYLNSELKKIGLEKFNEELVKLINFFFEDGKREEFTIKLAKHVLNSKVLENTEKKTATEIVLNSKLNEKSGAKRRTILRILFPKKKSMQFSYPVLKKAVFLLPVFYVVRWFEVLIFRPKNVKRLKRVKCVEDREIFEVSEMHKSLGLDKI